MTTLRIEENIPLAPMTTFRIGGMAKYFALIHTEEELKAAVQFAKANGLPLFILGGGSNVLIGDNGFPGLVLKIHICGIEEHDSGSTIELSVGAGEVWDHLVTHTVIKGYAGIESLALIPGTVGGAVVQNIGAYASEIDSVIVSVDVYDIETDTVRMVGTAQCEFGYRESIFKHTSKHCVVMRATFRLEKNGIPHALYKDVAEMLQKKGITSPTIKDVHEAVIQIRTEKLPDIRTKPSAGSFFKNPIISATHFEKLRRQFPTLPGFPTSNGLIKIPLAWILDHICHVNGLQKGSVVCHERQPLVIVNTSTATAIDVLLFARDIASRVFDATEIVIEPEVVCVGCTI